MNLESMQTLIDFAAVHAFYLGLLEEILGHAVPVPNDANPGADKVSKSIQSLQHWLALLDLAIAPPAIRDGLKDSVSTETAEALLRYFCGKASGSDQDRDKTDFVTTFLYKTIIPAERQVRSEMNVDEPSEFEEELYTILGDQEVAPLAEEHRQLVREFPFVRQEVEELRTFDELMDSGVIQRVREIKQRFSSSFYHPRVLATIAEYNVFFGRQFDELFKQTAQHIKQFAATVQKQGGSIMSRVEGDVTVKHLTEVKEDEMLTAEYGSAQENFRKISKFKKAVDSRTKGRPQAAPEPQFTPAVSPRTAAPATAAAAAAPALVASAPEQIHTPSAVNPVIEQGKLRSAEDSIRNFILAADPKSANIVPLRNGNLALSSSEVETFRSDYGSEKSFRADFANVVRAAAAAQTRFMEELREYKAKQGSTYLWKPHADALTWLVTFSQSVLQQTSEVLKVAEQRGLQEKIATLKSSIQKLENNIQQAAAALQGNGQ
ncbi:MAG: hypothetical protein ACRD3E_07015 [Terriglobales bacterium]